MRPYAGGFFNDEARSGPYLASLTVTGPFLPSGPGDTPSRQRIFTCTPAAQSMRKAPCAQQILSTLARRAYRRPPSDAEHGPPAGPVPRRPAWGGASRPGSSSRYGTCSPIPPFCSASNASRTICRARYDLPDSPIWSWPPGCRSSSGAASRMTSSSTLAERGRLRDPARARPAGAADGGRPAVARLRHQFRGPVAVPAESAGGDCRIRRDSLTSTRACGAPCGARRSSSSRAFSGKTGACWSC